MENEEATKDCYAGEQKERRSIDERFSFLYAINTRNAGIDKQPPAPIL